VPAGSRPDPRPSGGCSGSTDFCAAAPSPLSARWPEAHCWPSRASPVMTSTCC